MSARPKAFRDGAAFRAWLVKNHRKADVLWIRYYKKGSGKPSITYAQALDEALCFGWIDGQVKRGDALSWIQRYTPRRAKSLWSKRNRVHVARLIKEKRMQEAGLEAVRLAKRDGRWARAYDSPKTARPSRAFLQALAASPKAKARYAQLKKSEIYSICYRLQTARKEETRQRWIERIISQLVKEEK